MATFEHRCCARRQGAALAFGLLALALLPQVAQGSEPDQTIRAGYCCRSRFDAVEVTALFFNRPPAELVLLEGETATRLPQQPAASGSRYGNHDQEFWIKGDQAVWTRGQAAPLPCGPAPAAVR